MGDRQPVSKTEDAAPPWARRWAATLGREKGQRRRSATGVVHRGGGVLASGSSGGSGDRGTDGRMMGRVVEGWRGEGGRGEVERLVGWVGRVVSERDAAAGWRARARTSPKRRLGVWGVGGAERVAETVFPRLHGCGAWAVGVRARGKGGGERGGGGGAGHVGRGTAARGWPGWARAGGAGASRRRRFRPHHAAAGGGAPPGETLPQPTVACQRGASRGWPPRLAARQQRPREGSRWPRRCELRGLPGAERGRGRGREGGQSRDPLVS